MKTLRVNDQVKDRPVFGDSVLQTAQFVDSFFSADVANPRRLIRQGLAPADSEFLNGIGRLVVWVPRTSPTEVE